MQQSTFDLIKKEMMKSIEKRLIIQIYYGSTFHEYTNNTEKDYNIICESMN